MATLGLVAFLWLTVFQLVLALGAPIGQMAWGGVHKGRLPGRLRLASLAIAPLGILGAFVVAQSAGFIAPLLPDSVIRALLWAFFALFALSLVGNAMSQSQIERLHGVPLCIVLCLSTGWLAWS